MDRGLRISKTRSSKRLRTKLRATLLSRPLRVMVTSRPMATISVSTRGAKRIRKGHLWIYRSDVRDAREAEGGAIVQVVDEANNFVGQAFYSDQSEIALRFLTTGSETIDRAWWRGRLLQCIRNRRSVGDDNAQRLVYAEGDMLPSIIIDRYAGHFVVQTLSQGA